MRLVSHEGSAKYLFQRVLPVENHILEAYPETKPLKLPVVGKVSISGSMNVAKPETDKS
jgi:hypothetical protein